jgi:Putative auto-transporter adhesin, head GIN domain
MRSLLLLPLAVLAALALAGCADDGPRTSQTRDVADFTRIENRSSVDVHVRVGDARRVQVFAGENVIDDVSTDVRDGTLEVDFDHSGWGGDDVEVVATVPALTGIDAQGSGDFDVEGIEAKEFELVSDGSSDIVLAGTAGLLNVSLDGSGDVDLAELVARDAQVSVDGSGDVDVRAAEQLEVRLDGSGDITYHGDPNLTQEVDGSGDLTHAGR